MGQDSQEINIEFTGKTQSSVASALSERGECIGFRGGASG